MQIKRFVIANDGDKNFLYLECAKILRAKKEFTLSLALVLVCPHFWGFFLQPFSKRQKVWFMLTLRFQIIRRRSEPSSNGLQQQQQWLIGIWMSKQTIPQWHKKKLFRVEHSYPIWDKCVCKPLSYLKLDVGNHPAYQWMFFQKWVNPGLFLFIFALFKHYFFTEKTVGFSRIRPWIVRVGG